MEGTHPYRAPAARERLMRTALRLFAQRGYHAVRTREIVEASGLTTGALYWYFRGKEDLLQKVVAENLMGFEDRVRLAISHTPDQNAKLAAAFQMFVEILAHEDDPHRDLLILLALRMPEGPEQADLGRISRERFVRVVEELVDGQYEPGEVAEVVALIQTAGLGVIVESARGVDVAQQALGGLLRVFGGGSLYSHGLAVVPTDVVDAARESGLPKRRGTGGGRTRAATKEASRRGRHSR